MLFPSWARWGTLDKTFLGSMSLIFLGVVVVCCCCFFVCFSYSFILFLMFIIVILCFLIIHNYNVTRFDHALVHIETSKKEVDILDFHRFVKLGNRQYDYNQLKQHISSALFGYCVPVSYAGDTLGKIWSQRAPKQRIVVAWNADNPDVAWSEPALVQGCIFSLPTLSMHQRGHAEPPSTCSFMKSSLFSHFQCRER